MPAREGQPKWRTRGYSRRAIRLLEPTLLLLLHHGSVHGYTMIDQLDSFGLEDVDPSAVYRSLRDMEERGWVVSSWDEKDTQGPPRRVYRLTHLGDEVLEWWVRDVQETAQIIDRLLDEYQRHMEQGEGDYH